MQVGKLASKNPQSETNWQGIGINQAAISNPGQIFSNISGASSSTSELRLMRADSLPWGKSANQGDMKKMQQHGNKSLNSLFTDELPNRRLLFHMWFSVISHVTSCVCFVDQTLFREQIELLAAESLADPVVCYSLICQSVAYCEHHILLKMSDCKW